MKAALVAVLAVSLFTGGLAQKINATLPADFTEFEPEVKQRQQVNYTGFVFNTADPAEVRMLAGPCGQDQRKASCGGLCALLILNISVCRQAT